MSKNPFALLKTSFLNNPYPEIKRIIFVVQKGEPVPKNQKLIAPPSITVKNLVKLILLLIRINQKILVFITLVIPVPNIIL